MSGIVKTIFGGSSSKEEAGNKAYGALSGALMPGVNTGQGAMGLLGGMLGVGDPTAAKAGMNNFLGSTGYEFLKNEGTRAAVGNAGSAGILNSGSTAKALVRFNNDLASTKIGEFMDKLISLGQLGNQSAGVVSDAGKYSTGSSSKHDGIFNTLFPGGLGRK